MTGEQLKRAFKECEVGKLMPKALYVHRSAVKRLPSQLQALVFQAVWVANEIDYDVVKIARDGRAVSFLSYPTFMTERHPMLERSVHVNLNTRVKRVRNYTASRNPPILHRKELFLAPDHPKHGEFAAQTAEDEAQGLLGRSDIGTLHGWIDALADCKEMPY
jgi:DNA phosphorothioation-associated putative methyltransferase